MIWILGCVSSSQEINLFSSGVAVKNLCREQISNQGDVQDQLSGGQKALESTFVYTVTLLKPQVIEFFQILSRPAQKCFP